MENPLASLLKNFGMWQIYMNERLFISCWYMVKKVDKNLLKTGTDSNGAVQKKKT